MLKRLSDMVSGAAREITGATPAPVAPAQTQPQPPGRVEAAVAAREALAIDFAGGWQPEDVALIARHATASEPVEGMITDFLGIRTRADLVPWAEFHSGKVLSDLPVPDDSVRAETIEYVAMLTSLESAPGSSFTMAELGASYGPWLCVGAVLARRTGRTDVHLTALEASSYFHRLIPTHLRDNGIEVGEDVRVIRGALADKPGTLRFPVVSSAQENGGQAVTGGGAADYVGRVVEHEDVPAMTLETVLPDRPIDFLHVDVQGSEGSAIPASIDFLNEHVRGLFIGTHSREIEGILLRTLHAHGWRLMRERPVKFDYAADRPDIVGWTTRDGGQFWMNPRV